MTLLTLVRHGIPLVDPELSPELWQLSPEALPGLRQLRRSGSIGSGARWFSSSEPKAVASAAALTDSPVEVVDALGEAARPAIWYEDPAQFETLVRRSMLEPHVPAATGWEPAAETQARVLAAVRTILTKAALEDVVLVGHGTAWTLLIAALIASPPDLDAWARMQLPDVAMLEVSAPGERRLLRSWGQG